MQTQASRAIKKTIDLSDVHNSMWTNTKGPTPVDYIGDENTGHATFADGSFLLFCDGMWVFPFEFAI